MKSLLRLALASGISASYETSPAKPLINWRFEIPNGDRVAAMVSLVYAAALLITL